MFIKPVGGAALHFLTELLDEIAIFSDWKWFFIVRISQVQSLIYAKVGNVYRLNPFNHYYTAQVGLRVR